MFRVIGTGISGGVMCLVAGLLCPGHAPAVSMQPDAIVDFAGRWDLTALDTEGFSSAWLEITGTTSRRAQGRLVWLYGGAEQVDDIVVEDRTMRFQHSFMGDRLTFEARIHENRLEGTARGDRTNLHWIGVRAPGLYPSTRPAWGRPRSLLNGQDLSGWAPRSGNESRCWRVEKKILFNESLCTDLVSESRFDDFQLHVEFLLLDGGGSGVYLRGRYEVQIGNDAGLPAGPRTTGAIFGQLSPSSSEGKPLGEWQALDVTIVGRHVTVAVNGRRVISESEIPGITGAALDSHEELPGPIMLQGDHGRIAFRNIVLTPAR
jgi:hypothetical protein